MVSSRFARRVAPVLAVLSLLTAGCDDPPTTQGAAATASAKAVENERTPVASEPVLDLKAPEDVVVYGGSTSLLGFLKGLDGVANAVQPGAGTMEQDATKELASSLGLKDASGIDLNKPAHMIFVDPKKHEEKGAIVLLSTTGADKFKASLPDGKKEKDGDNALSWQSKNDKTVYGNMVGDTVVLTLQPQMFKDKQGFIEQLSAAKLDSEVSVVFAAAHAAKIYDADVKDFWKMMRAQMGSQAQMMPGMDMAGLVDSFEKIGNEVDRVALNIDVDDDGVQANLQMTPKAGTELEKIFKAAKGTDNKILAKLPKDTPFFMTMSIDPEALDSMQDLFGWAMTMSYGTAAEDVKKASTEYWGATDGSFAMALTKLDGIEGPALLAVTGIKDAEKARAAQATMFEASVKATKEGPLGKAGVNIEWKKDAYKIGDVSVDTTTTKMGDLGAGNPVLALTQSLMSTHVGIKDDVSVLAYGPEGKKVLTAFFDGKVEGGLDGTDSAKKAIETAAPNAFFLVYLDSAKLAKALIPPDAPAPPLEDSPHGLSASLGSDNGKLQLNINVPTKQVKNVAVLMMQMQQAMMGAMGGPGGMPPGAMPPSGMPK